MGNEGFPLMVMMVAATAAAAAVAMVPMVPMMPTMFQQRNDAPTSYDYPDYSTKYEEYPVLVPPKRAALLFDQLMVALQKVVDNEGRSEVGGSRGFARSSGPRSSNVNSQIAPSTDEETVKMDLQRRGQATKGRVYWRCYFNAVTCFKRKR